MKKVRIMCLFILPMVPLLTVSVQIFRSPETVSYGQIINLIAFGNVSISRLALMEFIYSWLPLLFFQVVYGTVIYGHYTSASVYYFTRCESRLRWYRKEIAGLLGMSVAYVFLILAYVGAAGLVSGRMSMDSASFRLAFYFLLIDALWLFIMTLLVNVLAILLGSVGSFLLIGGFQAVCIALYGIWDQWLDVSTCANMLSLKAAGRLEELAEMENLYGPLEQIRAEAADKLAVIKAIPFSNLILKWHTSSNESLNRMISDLGTGYSYPLGMSAGILIAGAAIAVLAGYQIVRRAEFMGNEREA